MGFNENVSQAAWNISVINATVQYDTTFVAFYSFFIVLCCINIILHATGCVLLYSTLERGRGYIQQLFIMNLSITELLKNMNKLFRYIVKLLRTFYNTPKAIKDASHYILINYVWGTYLLYFLFMVYITADRFLGTILNIKYQVYITEIKANVLVTVSWVLTVLLCIILSLVYYITGYSLLGLLSWQLYGAFHSAYIILAIVTYLFIFRKFTQSRRIQVRKNKRGETMITESNRGLFQTFKESRFFICILIITSFLFFSVIPGLAIIYMYIQFQDRMTREIKLTMLKIRICYVLSDTVDACIYIFLQRSLRRLLLEKMKILLECCLCNILRRKKKQQQVQEQEQVEMLSLRQGAV